MLIKICLEKLLAESVPLQKYKEMREVISKSLEEVQNHPNTSLIDAKTAAGIKSMPQTLDQPNNSNSNSNPVNCNAEENLASTQSNSSWKYNSSNISGSNSFQYSPLTASNSAFYWVPFKLAFQPNTSPKMKEIALDSIQKLISFKVFGGSSVGFEEFENPMVPPTPLDEKSSILPSTSNPNNSINTSSTTIGKLSPSFQQDSLSNFSAVIENQAFNLNNNNDFTRQRASYPDFSLIDDIVGTITESFMVNSSVTLLHIPTIRVLLTIFVSCEIHGFAMMKAIQVVYRIFLLSANNIIVQTTAKAGLTQMITTMFSKLTRLHNECHKKHQATLSKEHQTISVPSPLSSMETLLNIVIKDCQVLFRYLCQIIAKPELDQIAAANLNPNVALQGRILAYELILSALNQSGAAIKNDSIFLHLIRKDLFLSLSKTGVSVNPSLFELTLSVFLMLLNLFHAQIKAEVEVLFNEIYLRILESPNATFQQKYKVLQSILKISGNPQYVVDIYVNYDCDFGMESIYERIVLDLCKMSQGRTGQTIEKETVGVVLDSQASSPEEKNSRIGLLGFGNVSPEQAGMLEGKIRVKSLKCIVSLVASLLRWSSELAPSLGQRQPPTGIIPITAPGETSIDENSLSVYASPVSHLSPVDNSSHKYDEAVALVNDPSDLLEQENRAIIMPKSPLNIISMGGAGGGIAGSSSSGSNQMSPNNGAFAAVANSSSASAAASAAASMDPAKLEEAKTKKRLLKEGLNMFNSKPKAGIRFLVENNIITSNPADIVELLLQSLGSLNKKSLGEYFGESDELGIKVMHAFVDRLNFKNIPFVTGLRSFLQYFRLPGEAQKIDRIMEKFAARYFETYSDDVFADAGAAYTLAFSVIMLNTDLHSPSIKKRMEKHEFIRNNRGINDNSDLPDDYLSVIYDEISSNEIILEDERGFLRNSSVVPLGRPYDIYERESAQMKAKSEARFKGPRPPASPFRNAVHAEHVKSMFELIWAPLLAALSRMFEEAPQPQSDSSTWMFGTFSGDSGSGSVLDEIAQLCLEGLLGAIRISCIFGLDLPRDAYVSALAKFTHLHQSPSTSLSDIIAAATTRKSLAAFRALLHVAKTDGDFLDNNWIIVLQCITKVDSHLAAVAASGNNLLNSNGTQERGIFAFMNLIKSGGASGGFAPGSSNNHSHSHSNTINTAASALSPTSNNSNSNSNSGTSSKGKVMAAEFQNQEMLILIDHIFADSVKLNGSAIVYFFRALCQVSVEEIEACPVSPSSSNSNPNPIVSLFCLQRIVEIAYYNLSRIRLEWTQIWKVIAPHFNMAGSHGHYYIANYAVDALRQLSLKLLEREELAHFHTQYDFLKSFEHIMRMQSQALIRVLVVDSLSQLIMKRGEYLKSGWKSIFVVFGRAASDSDTNVLDNAFNWVRLVSANYLDHIDSGTFVDYIHCLVDFGANGKKSETALEAIKFLQINGKRMLAKMSGMTTMEEENFYLCWFPILSGLSKVILESPYDRCQRGALDAMGQLLLCIGDFLSAEYWKTLYRSVIMPMFEDLRGGDPNSSAGGSIIWRKSLALLVELFSAEEQHGYKFPRLLVTESPDVVFDGVFDLIELMIRTKNETFGPSCLTFMGQLVASVKKYCQRDQWLRILKHLKNVQSFCLDIDLFKEILSSNPSISDSADKNLSGDSMNSLINDPEENPTPPGSNTTLTNGNSNFGVAKFTNSEERETAQRLLTYQSTIHLAFLDMLKDLLVVGIHNEGLFILDEVIAIDGNINNISNSISNQLFAIVKTSLNHCKRVNNSIMTRALLRSIGVKLEGERLFYLKHEITSTIVVLASSFYLYKSTGLDEPFCQRFTHDSFVLLRQYIIWHEKGSKKALEKWSSAVSLVYHCISSINWWNNTEDNHTEIKFNPSSTTNTFTNTDTFPSTSSNTNTNTNTFPSTNTTSSSSSSSAIAMATSKFPSLRKHLVEYFKIAVKLMAVDGAHDLRNELSRFMEKVGNHFLTDIVVSP